MKNVLEETLTHTLDIDDEMSGPTGLSLFNLVRDRMGWTDQYLAEINDPEHPPLFDVDTMVSALEVLRTSGKELTA